MSLNLLTSALRVAGKNAMSLQAWIAAEEAKAAKVAKVREYAEGDQDPNTTTEMRNLIGSRSRFGEDSHEFNANHCAPILDTMLDRIQLKDVRADITPVKPVKGAKPALPATPTDPNAEPEPPQPPPIGEQPEAGEEDEELGEPADPVNDWISELLERNRIDALQVDVHESTLRDGNSFLMVYPETEKKGTLDEQTVVRFSHEPAYDGSFGMIVMYETTASRAPLLAIKVWKITSTEIADTVRVNVYYADRIERFASQSATVNGTPVTSLEEYSGDGEPAVMPWLAKDGSPLGVPVIHFRNRGGSVNNFGLSELENVIPLQDALNGTMVSMVATTLLTGFPIRALIGALAPAAVTPGLTLSFYGKDTAGNPTNPTDVVNEWLKTIRLEQFEVADLSPFIAQAEWLKTEMYAVTNTPTDDVAANASGEARKQSEVKLIGKVRRFQVRNGNAWEDAVRMAARVAEAYTSDAVPEFEDLTAEWQNPEVRNHSQMILDMNALVQSGIITKKQARKQLQSAFDWTDDDLQQMDDEQESNRVQKLAVDQQALANAANTISAVSANGNGAMAKVA